jgi:hypothetical protein
MFLDLSIECSYAFVRWVELELCPTEDCCTVLVVCFFNPFMQYMFKVILRDLTCLIWVVFWNESCRYFQYLSREYLFTNFGWIVWEIWICEGCCQFHCQNRWLSTESVQGAESEKGYESKVVAYLNTILTNIYSHSFAEYFVSYGFLKSAVLQFEDRKQSRFVNCFRSIRF